MDKAPCSTTVYWYNDGQVQFSSHLNCSKTKKRYIESIMSNVLSLLRFLVLAISLVSHPVFGSLLENRPHHGIRRHPRSIDIGFAASALTDGFTQAMPPSSTQSSQRGSAANEIILVAREQASAKIAIPAPTLVQHDVVPSLNAATPPRVTSVPNTGPIDCGNCFLFFQVSYQGKETQFSTNPKR